MTEDASCEDCTWCLTFATTLPPHEIVRRECRRFPPTTVPVQDPVTGRLLTATNFPIVRPEHFCGEFVKAESVRETMDQPQQDNG